MNVLGGIVIPFESVMSLNVLRSAWTKSADVSQYLASERKRTYLVRYH